MGCIERRARDRQTSLSQTVNQPIHESQISDYTTHALVFVTSSWISPDTPNTNAFGMGCIEIPTQSTHFWKTAPTIAAVCSWSPSNSEVHSPFFFTLLQTPQRI
jgi:hypothetical protein